MTARRAQFHSIVTLFLVLMCAASGLSAAEAPESDKRPTDEQVRFFEKTIRPLLAKHCYDCHGPDTQESELRLDSLKGILSGGKAGAAVVPGKPKSSLLLTAVGYQDNTLQMPPDGKLSDVEIAALTKWVAMGAPHPDSGRTDAVKTKGIDVDEARRHWAFRPPVKPPVPEVSDPDCVRTPVDAFILHRLENAAEGQSLKPAPRADKRTLIRRVTFDLTGLPPTPEEVEEFLADTEPGAYARLVDRLLDSPHYGERWGRHWLDVARYADSNGLDENVAHGNAWRYRDYVVESFNADKPYDQFLIEQLAGDRLDSGDDVDLRNERRIATGFLSLGPKVLAEVDERKMEMDIVDEQIDTIGRSLLGLTLGCARCHDHKFDPIDQHDYYALAGIFQSTRTMETFKKVAKWNEVSIATPQQLAQKKAHDAQAAALKAKIEKRVATANAELRSQPDGEKKLAKNPEAHYPAETKAELARLRKDLEQLEANAPVLPTAMGVTDGDVRDAPIHIRGSHLTLGETVPRRFPQALTTDDAPEIEEGHSGRLALARWLTRPDHPLTARVMVNRIWRWHFGKGLVPTPDNFGLRGEPPTHPQLLDWLAVRFVEEGWSVKAVHRLILLSNTYQLADRVPENHPGPDPSKVDPENGLYWRHDVRRLEAEAIRDALLAVSGTLDKTMGGSLLAVGNREYLFNHTSQDKSSYDTKRRSIYIPVVRNHLYGMFQLFDYSDASVINGSRATSTIAPQALFLMNSDFVSETAEAMAKTMLAEEDDDAGRIERLYERAYARPPTQRETERALGFLDAFAQRAPGSLPASANEGASPDTGEQGARARDPEQPRQRAWQALCQAIVSANEFVYVR